MLTRIRKCVTASLALVLLAMPMAYVRGETLTLHNVNQTKGLPNNHITELFKDSRGFLWIGTSAGLLRYDGYSARRVSDMVGKRTGVLSEQIFGIQEDALGRLWVQSESSYAIYDPLTNTLIDSVPEYIKHYGISGYLTAVLSDDFGNIWIATQQEGLYRIAIKEDKAEKCISDQSYDKRICSLKMIGGKIIGVTNLGELVETTPDKMKLRLISKGPYETEPEATHHYLSGGKSHKLWVLTQERVLLYDMDSNSWQNALVPSNGYLGIIKNMYNDSRGNLWIARDHQGIEKLEFKDGKYVISKVPTAGDFIPHSTVSAILEDDKGTLLFGTYKFGLYSYNESVNKFKAEDFSRFDIIPDVNCMVASKDGSVWIGTDNSGLWKWIPGSRQHMRIQDATEQTPNAITALEISPYDVLYIGKFAKGLYRCDDEKVTLLSTGTDIDRSYIWSLCFDRYGILWIGTLGNGVFRYDPQTHACRNFTTANSGLHSDFITSVMNSRDGKIYIGSSGGVSSYDPNKQILTSVIFDGNPDLDDSKIMQIYEDTRGLIWILTTSGLKVLDNRKGKLHDVTTDQPLYGADMFGIIEDNNGGMWVSYSSKLINLKVSYNDADGKLEVSRMEYDRESGLPGYDFNQRSFVKLPDGSIAVGNPFGIIHFHPSQLVMDMNRPKVLFTDLYMDNKPIEAGEKIGGRVALKKAIYAGETIEFNHNPKEFTIFFTSDNYALPEKTRYKYRLEGYSDQWTECPEGVNYVTYTNLSPGNYTLQVVGINEDGYESESPANIGIKIYPSFWGTPLAWLIYAVIAAVIIAIIVRIVRRYERKVLEQEKQHQNQRKQEDLNRLKFKFFTNVSHDLRTPLTLILSPLDDMIKESTDARQKKRLTQMRNNAMRLLALVNQLLDFRKADEAGLHLNPSEGDIVAFARTVCTSFASLSERKNINLTFYSAQERIELLFDADKMGKIFMNLLGNAFKFTPEGGRIDVSIELSGDDGNMLRIQVSDTGIGIKDEDKKHIFERFYQASDDIESNPGTGSGIGLSMVSEYVKLHEGTIRVADNIERGSVFIIELPVRHSEGKQTANCADNPVSPGISEAKANESGEDANVKEIGSRRKIVLVVDDSPDMTELLKDSLESSYDVVTAPDGAVALKKSLVIKPDIILTDLMMPNMNGMELCRALKENKETVNIPIIILTAKYDLGVKLEGLTIGADDYITKPFNIDVLRLRMHRLIELSSKGARRTLIEPEPDNIKITPLDEKLIEKAMKYVSQNISKPELSVEELSGVLAMSRVSLYKKIKQITGKSPIEFIRIIRLKRAAQLLRESQLNVSEIAYQTGFNNPKMFSRYFKEEFGIHPSVYQAQEEGKAPSQIL